MDFGIWIVLSALVGAKLLLVAVEWRRFSVLIVPLAAVMLLVLSRRGGSEPISARQAQVA